MLEELNERNRKHFDFLITDYGFRYLGFNSNGKTIYGSNQIIIECYMARDEPSMIFKLVSEPEYIIVDFGNILETAGVVTRDEYQDYIVNNGLENNMAHLKTLFSKVNETILDDPESWWLDAQKLKFKSQKNSPHHVL